MPRKKNGGYSSPTPILELEPRRETKKSRAYQRLRRLDEILRKETDDTRPISRGTLLKRMQEEGYEFNEDTLREDFRDLKAAGADIHCCYIRGRLTGFYSYDRELDYSALKLLSGLVQSAGYITPKKTAQLLDFLKGLAYVSDRERLEKTARRFNTRKRSHEDVDLYLDYADDAIYRGRKLSFTYWDDIYTDASGTRLSIPHKHPQKTVEPYATVVYDDRNYLLAWDPKASETRTYRIDRMTEMRVIEEPCGAETKRLAATDIAAELTSAFKMFASGDRMEIPLVFERSVMGAIHDKFGERIPLEDLGDERFRVKVSVQMSDVFYGWLLQFNGRIRIEGLEEAQESWRAEKDRFDRAVHEMYGAVAGIGQ